jgi:hypothetical protein
MDGLEALHNLYQHGRFVTINLGEEPRFKGCTTHRVDVIPVAIWLDCGLGNEDVERTSSNLLVKCSQIVSGCNAPYTTPPSGTLFPHILSNPPLNFA